MWSPGSLPVFEQKRNYEMIDGADDEKGRVKAKKRERHK